jgi:hypothetical protein
MRDMPYFWLNQGEVKKLSMSYIKVTTLNHGLTDK